MKRCQKCKRELPATNKFFHKHEGTLDDLQCYCKKCVSAENKRHYAKPENRTRIKEHSKIYNNSTIGRFNYIVRKFGATKEQAEQIIKQQDNGICDSCGGRNSNGRRLSVDHNHYTKKIRGLLCSGCNSVVGFANEHIEKLHNVIIYLEKST